MGSCHATERRDCKVAVVMYRHDHSILSIYMRQILPGIHAILQLKALIRYGLLNGVVIVLSNYYN